MPDGLYGKYEEVLHKLPGIAVKVFTVLLANLVSDSCVLFTYIAVSCCRGFVLILSALLLCCFEFVICLVFAA